MYAPQIYNKGKLRLITGTYATPILTLDLECSDISITFKKETFKQKTINKRNIRILDGYRVFVEATAISITQSSYQQFQSLIDIMNNSFSYWTGSNSAPYTPTFVVIPNYTGDSTDLVLTSSNFQTEESDSAVMQLTNEVKFEDIVKNIDAGQKIKLNFESEILWKKNLPKGVKIT